ncbi:hypothetical protein ACS0TY_001779 [Phlomoides rotata]
MTVGWCAYITGWGEHRANPGGDWIGKKSTREEALLLPLSRALSHTQALHTIHTKASMTGFGMQCLADPHWGIYFNKVLQQVCL